MARLVLLQVAARQHLSPLDNPLGQVANQAETHTSLGTRGSNRGWDFVTSKSDTYRHRTRACCIAQRRLREGFGRPLRQRVVDQDAAA